MSEDFKQQMKDDFSPRLEKMLEKEIAHSEYLGRMKNGSNADVITNMVRHSENFITHLKQRICEYKEYINSIK